LTTARFRSIVRYPIWPIALVGLLSGVAVFDAQGPGGFVEPATSTTVRPAIPAASTFVPSRGAFTFPAPYNTPGVRITNASDCGGQDCVLPVGYSYWNNINNSAGSDAMLIVLSLERRRGGNGPTLFSVNKNSGAAQNLGPIFGPESPYSWASGEGWYFSRTRPSTLYLNDGARMLRYDVQSRTMETVFDAASQFGGNRYIWQMHSSTDDRVHSATLRDSGSYEMLGCLAYREEGARWYYFARQGDYDECQIDKSGRWLVIKENVDGRYGEDNRIIDLETGGERVLLDEHGAAGHSDVGYGYLVAEDDFHAQPGAVRVWRFDMDLQAVQPVEGPGQGTLVYQLASWNSGLGHVAHGNARPDVPIDQQVVCSSNASRQALPRVNEVVCYRLNDSLTALIVAPNLVDLDAQGGGTDDYWKLPKGNLDPTGEYFIWTANAGTNRLDAYLVRVPASRLSEGGSSPAPPPAAPANLLGATNGSQVTLSWTNPAAGAAPTGIVLNISGASNTTLALPVSETFAYPAMPPGTYTFRVTAANGSSTSPASNGVTLTFPGACPGPPQPPTAVQVIRSNRTLSASWLPPASGPALTHYTVHVTGAFIGSFPTTSRTMSGTVGPGRYHIGVTTANACGASTAAALVMVTVP
jgi:hypothetical protein